MIKIIDSSTENWTKKLFVGELYPEKDQSDEFMSHLSMRVLESNTDDYWLRENEPETPGILTLLDKKQNKAFIGRLHDSKTPHREGFENIVIDGTRLLKLIVELDHRDGELAKNEAYDRMLQESSKDLNYKFAYVTYDNMFDATKEKNHLTINYIY